MENQPSATQQPATTGRQWFRLASLARLESLRQMEAPPAAPAVPAPTAPTPPPVPRIPLPRAQVEPLQPQPQPQPQRQLPPSPRTPTNRAPPSPSPGNTNGAAQSIQPLMPPRPTVTPLPAADTGFSQASENTPVAQSVQAATSPPPGSPRGIIQSLSSNPLPESPKIQHQLPPIKAPTPHPEPELKPSPAPTPTKNMYMQQGNNSPSVHVKTVADNNENPPLNGSQYHAQGKKETASTNGTGSTATSPWRKKDDMKVITMAGENMGAYMEIGKQQQRGHLLHQRTKGSETQDENGKSDKGRNPAGAAANGKPITALVNSNVQSINNSIVFRSSCTQHSPGVHMTLISEGELKHKHKHKGGGH